ncbi:MAG: metallophosphoesterase, partial [Chitinophagaceae bacterium]
DNFIVTAPPAATNRKVRVAVFGDCGRNDNSYQNLTLSAYLNYVGANPAELMLLLGDNAYNNGTDAEYQSNFFNIYSGSILKNHALFPAPGNHDYANTAARQADKNVPYYANFTLPAAAQCGGVASATECYYSYDWGNIHFLSLDSYGTETGSALRLYDTTGPQVTWIKQDLAANTKKWTIAYWHHPPYTMGSHNSDTETELVKMRQNFIRILENAGVDMILCGHSHDYERSYLLKNYTANESSFSLPQHAVNTSSGKYDNTTNSCAYVTQGGKVNHGTVYVVAGSAGASGGVQAGYPHNALPFAINDGGMFYFEVDDNRLDAKFIRKDGVLYDQFTLMKDAGVTQTVSVTAGQPITLTASWKGTYVWNTGATTRSITVSPSVTTVYTCSDGFSCLTDQLTVNVTGGAVAKPVTAVTESKGQGLTVYPIPVHRGQRLHITSGSLEKGWVELVSATGQILSRKLLMGNAELSTQDLRPGLYFLRYTEGQQTFSKRIVISE